MKTFKYILLIAVLAAFASCEPVLEDFTPKAGNADFTRYVALGNSLTAGVADAALYRSGQENSYPAIMASQFKSVGGGEFKQPLVTDEFGVGARLILGASTSCTGEVSLGPVPYPGSIDPANLLPIGSQGPFQNMGVPGALVSHLLAPGYGMQNLFFGRFASDQATSSILGDAAGQMPTFFSLFMGSNDVLGYATSGGENTSGELTDPTEFANYYGMVVGGMTATGAKGAISNVPDVTIAPFFNVIPWAGLVISTQEQADALNAAYAPLGFQFQVGYNGFVIQDLNAPGAMRQATAGDHILLSIPQDSLRCAGWGSMKPIPHNYILDAQEVANIRNSVNAFNIAIGEVAAQYGLALVDMNQLFNNAQTGVIYDGVTFTTEFVSGGFISLDGLHLNGKGNAIVANKFIDAINDYYGAEIPRVVVNDYPGVLFP